MAAVMSFASATTLMSWTYFEAEETTWLVMSRKRYRGTAGARRKCPVPLTLYIPQ